MTPSISELEIVYYVALFTVLAWTEHRLLGTWWFAVLVIGFVLTVRLTLS